MRYLRFIVPAAALSFAFGFILPEFKVSVPGGFTGFLLNIGLGAAFALLYNGYKAVEPRIVRRFSGNKLRPEHVFYIGLAGLAVTTAVSLSLLAHFTTLLHVGGFIAAAYAGICLTMIGTALVPSPTLRADQVEEPKVEPAPVEEPKPAVEPAPAATEQPVAPPAATSEEKAVVAETPTDAVVKNDQVVSPSADAPGTQAPPAA